MAVLKKLPELLYLDGRVYIYIKIITNNLNSITNKIYFLKYILFFIIKGSNNR